MRMAISGCLLVLWSLGVGASDWRGRVVRVHDGDTVTVARAGFEATVRLDEIDAPELGQAYGSQSRQSLVGLCLNRPAEIHGLGEDKYGRVLGRVSCAGTDANAEQVRRGYAWFYVQYGRDMALRDYEASARTRRVGLWAASRPEPPWEFRHEGGGHGSGGTAGSGKRVGICGAKSTCGDMADCDEAMFYLKRCGITRLDRNKDGVPCESLCR